MDSNDELDKILKVHKLLIRQSQWSRQKHQDQPSGTKSVQKVEAQFHRDLIHGRTTP